MFNYQPSIRQKITLGYYAIVAMIVGGLATARLQDAVHNGDRVEIYRPLVADPKEARRARATRRGKKL